MNTSCKIELLSVLFLCLLFSACGNLGPTGGHRAQFLVTLTSLSPSSVMAGAPPFTLTVNGSNFQSEPQTLVWNGGQQLDATNVTASQATFTIDASMIANPGNISIQFIDGINGNQLSNALTLTVNPRGQTACALFGTYTYLFAGFETVSQEFGVNEGGVAELGAFGVDADGTVSGEQTFFFYPFEQNGAAYNGTCTNGTVPNQGTLMFNFSGPGGTSVGTSSYTFVLEQGAAEPSQGRLFEPSQSTAFLGTTSGSGVFRQIAPNSTLNGSYVFGLMGTDENANEGGSQISTVGSFTVNNGNVTAGVADINDGGAVTANVPLSGSVSSNPSDAFSPVGISFLIGGGQYLEFTAYVDSSGSGLALGGTNAQHNVLAGFISPQANPGTYNNGSLGAPIILSTEGTPPPLYSGGAFTSASDTTIGLASGFDSNAATFNLLLDNVSGGAANLNQTVTGASYNVASNGRTTVSYTSGGQTRNYVYYLDNVNDGYILGLDNNAEFGFFQPQASGPFNTASINGTFAAGTLLPETPGSPNLATEVTLTNGNLTASTPSGALSGTYSVTDSGRGTATVNLPVLGGNDLVLYVIDPQSVLLMGSDNTASDAITFMHF